ncbi:MAG: T9SS type A sorting domain-containing protein [Bacteroidales bacterium]|nr:T9SS type A sorting domain-containing protein [Bacteroidales bacterium]
MRHFLLMILLLFSFNNLKSQDTTFNKYLYPFNGTTSIYSLISNDSTYYALLGQMGIDYKQNYGILKINKAGITIDSSLIFINNKYWGTDVNDGHAFILTRDSSFLYCGGIKDTAGWVSGFLAKFDYNLDTIWTKIFYHPDTAISLQNPNNSVIKLSDIKQTPDGGYIVVGNYNKDCIGYVNRSFLMKIDSNGNIQNYYSNNFNSQSYDIEVNPLDSGYVYLSVANNTFYLIKANKYGVTQWTYPLTTSNIHRMAQDITFLNDSIIVIGSSYIYSQNGYPNKLDVLMFNINSKTLIWRKNYQIYYSFQNITLDQSININITKDSNLVVSGTAHVVSPDSTYGASRGIILKLNQNGDSLWCRYYAHNWNDTDNVDLQLNDLIVCDDGGFLFGGFASVQGAGFTNSWLVKTDSMGMTQAAFTVGVEENTLVIKKQKPLLYPNPATDNFRLRFEQSPTEDYELSIYSVSGALVKQQLLSALDNEYRVDIGELKSGVYFVRLESDGEIVFSGKFVKQ